jgi:hypothetical protein
MYSYIYSSDQNPKWQKERPSYRKGVIKKIHDAKYVDVQITWSWKGGVKETKRCRVDYMTCDTTAFAVDDEVLVKFENSDARKPFVAGKWDDPGLCDAYLYCAIKIGNRITDFSGGDVSESSVSSQSSSSSQYSKSSESASSDSEGIKGLDDYYAFVWDPKNNDFAVIPDSITGETIQFPCRAERLEQWLLDSSDVTSINMENRRAGRESTVSGAGYGLSKKRFYDGNWSDMITCLDEGNQPDACIPADDCPETYCAGGEEYWKDFYDNIWGRCGLYESGVINEANPLTGQTDSKSFLVERSCYDDGGSDHDDRLVVATASVDAALVPREASNHDVFSTFVHALDGWEINTLTSEDVDAYLKQDIVGGSEINDIYTDVEYTTETFLGTMYSNLLIREHSDIGSSWYAQALLTNTFAIGRRCAVGTFVWLGLQGVTLRVDNYTTVNPLDKPWVIQNFPKYNLAYCDAGGYGTDPFTGKADNVRISNAITAMISQFYNEDPGGAVLDFEVDARWVSGPTGSYSSISSSSESSSSSSFSSESSSESSESSTSSSSESSESIP